MNLTYNKGVYGCFQLFSGGILDVNVYLRLDVSPVAKILQKELDQAIRGHGLSR